MCGPSGQPDPPEQIDLGIGEARSVRDALESTFGLEFFHRSTDEELDYQPSRGNPHLVAELEQLHHGASCVVTAGAKQGVFVALMVAKDRGCKRVGMRDPAWPPLVHAVRSLGLELVLCEPRDLERYDCFLLVSPNNPDGKTHSLYHLERLSQELHRAGKFLIHDAAYACAPYVRINGEPRPVGDVQVHSVSKRFGLSGLRVGWAVTRDRDVRAALQEAMETVSAGVCGTAQGAVARLLKRTRTNPRLAAMFKEEACAALDAAREAADAFNPDVLEPDAHPNEGAFAWCRKGRLYDPIKLGVTLVDGKDYGYPNHVRVNLVGGLGNVRCLNSRSWSPSCWKEIP